MNKLLALCGLLFLTSSVNADNPVVCFTPGQDCTSLIVKEISNAQKSIYVQAYTFTSLSIATALINAKSKGISVNVILDKTQTEFNHSSVEKFLFTNKIPIWTDYQPAIAHNKVIIIDKHEVITGSFNFTNAAQRRNAENVLIIDNAELANLYLQNWFKRETASRLTINH